MVRLLVAVALLWGSAARALAPNDRVEVVLEDGRVIGGWYQPVEAGVLLLTHGGEVWAVPLSLVESALVNDEPVPASALAAVAPSVSSALTARPLPAPAPGAVVGLSLVWPGLGHAALGEWGGAASYAVVNGVFWGTGAWAISERQLGVLFPLAGLDLLFRGWSAAEARRMALRRRSSAPSAPHTARSGAAIRWGGLTAPSTGE